MFFRYIHRKWVKATGSVLDSRFHSARDSVVRLAYIVRPTLHVGHRGSSRSVAAGPQCGHPELPKVVHGVTSGDTGSSFGRRGH